MCWKIPHVEDPIYSTKEIHADSSDIYLKMGWTALSRCPSPQQLFTESKSGPSDSQGSDSNPSPTWWAIFGHPFFIYSLYV